MSTEKEVHGHQFGTFGGVFTPAILTIIGLILYLRAGWVVGECGLIQALAILLVAQGIVFIAGLSVSTLATNTRVKSGGAYFLISRSLGPGLGFAIGITLALAQAVAVPFHIFGFAEAMVKDPLVAQYVTELYTFLGGTVETTAAAQPIMTFASLDTPGTQSAVQNVMDLRPYYGWIAIITGGVILAIVYIGADFATKIQYFILAALGVSILVMLAGMGLNFSWDNFYANLSPMTQEMAKQISPGAGPVPITTLFAIYFPAVTGIMVGVNMSGDLKDPNRSIPRGVMLAILCSVLIYGVQMILFAGCATRAEMVNDSYQMLMKLALWGSSFLITIGVICATLSSAIGSLVVSPRILQSIANDKIIGGLTPFSKGFGEHNEPRRAILLVGLLVLCVLYWGSLQPLNESGMSDALNTVSEMVSMFFLYSYCLVNIAAMVECYSNNPSFRPTFKMPHWVIPLIGATACFGASFMINGLISAVSLTILIGLYLYTNRRNTAVDFNDTRQGFAFSQIRTHLRFLANAKDDHKNWRPAITILSRTPYATRQMAYFARRFEGQCGIITLATFTAEEQIVRKPGETAQNMILQMASHDTDIHPTRIYTENFDQALPVFLQSHSIGPLRPNLIMQGCPQSDERYENFARHLEMIHHLGFNTLTALSPLPAASGHPTRIDVWWTDKARGTLMLTLAYLASTFDRKSPRTLRLIYPIVPNQHEPAFSFASGILREQLSIPEIKTKVEQLEQMLTEARIKAEVIIVPSTSLNLPDLPLAHYSADAELVLLPLKLCATPGETAQLLRTVREQYHDALPPTFLVNSVGSIDLSV